MKKRDTKKDNIVLFPGLDRRLLEKGLDMLQQKKYRQAYELLEEARKLDPENSEIYIGLVLAYYESGNVKQARQLASEMLKKGIGNYIQVMDLYIMILVQLNEYDEIITTIEALLEDKEVPKEKVEHFSKMLHFSRRMAEEKTESMPDEELVVQEPADHVLNLIHCMDPQEQMMLAARLSKENIRSYISEIKVYLASSEGDPFLKTMLLNILKEQEYEKEILVEKFGMKEVFIPVSLPEINEVKKAQEVTDLLKEELESEDPVMYENIKTMVERNFFLLYPFSPKPGASSSWAAAYHYLGNLYFGMAESFEVYARQYGTSQGEIEEAASFIKEIEEISYPK